jgi:haloalkane dehalogenase
MIDPKMRYAKQKITVQGRQMAYVDVGAGDAIVFIHGNANSAYMWRNIMPYLEGAGRLIAIDNIGQGDSDKLPNSGPGSYTLAEHQSYIDGALDALDVGDRQGSGPLRNRRAQPSQLRRVSRWSWRAPAQGARSRRRETGARG